VQVLLAWVGGATLAAGQQPLEQQHPPGAAHSTSSGSSSGVAVHVATPSKAAGGMFDTPQRSQ